jgi:hypothetical protein
MPELWKSLFAGHALALALSGDRCNNLLFRLLNGEMPDTLQAKAWWILIGTNDVADRCSKQSILVGNLAVLEEVMWRKPNSRFILQDSYLVDGNDWTRTECGSNFGGSMNV